MDRDDVEICLACGGVVDPIATGAGQCGCPPPSLAPRSAPSVDRGFAGYREAFASSPCPRCRGRITIARHHDTDLLECANCFGIFLTKDLVLALAGPLGSSLRVAFPKRTPPSVLAPVSYIPCITCGTMMNRTIFGKISGVIVDVCKDHGVWFDAGEIAAVIAFIEAGGLAVAEARRHEEHAAERAKLERQFKRVRAEHIVEIVKTRHNTGWGVFEDDLRKLFV